MKEKNTAVSNRDRQLLSILVAFVILFLCYFFIAGPAIDNGSILSEDLKVVEASLQRSQDIIAQAPQLKRDVTTKRSELNEKYSMFLYRIDESRILHQMDALMIASGLPTNTYQISQSSVGKVDMPVSTYLPNQYPLLEIAKNLNPDLVEPQAEGNNNPITEPTSENSSVVEQTDIGIGFAGAGYDAVYRFLSAVEALERSFIVSDISIGKDPQTAGLEGQILFRAIALPKVDETEANDMEFQPIVPKGRPSPF